MIYFIFIIVGWVLMAGCFATALIKLADFFEWMGKSYDYFNDKYVKTKPKTSKAL